MQEKLIPLSCDVWPCTWSGHSALCSYLESRPQPLCASSIFTVWPPWEKRWGFRVENLYRPEMGGASSLSPHALSTVLSHMAMPSCKGARKWSLALSPGRRQECGIHGKGSWREKSLHFPMSEVQRLHREDETVWIVLFLSPSPPEVMSSVFKKWWKENKNDS